MISIISSFFALKSRFSNHVVPLRRFRAATAEAPRGVFELIFHFNFSKYIIFVLNVTSLFQAQGRFEEPRDRKALLSARACHADLLGPQHQSWKAIRVPS